MQLWRERLGSCLGFDTQAEAPTSPALVLLVNRPQQQARHLEGAEQLLAAAQVALGGTANVTLRYMEVRWWRHEGGRGAPGVPRGLLSGELGLALMKFQG